MQVTSVGGQRGVDVGVRVDLGVSLALESCPPKTHPDNLGVGESGLCTGHCAQSLTFSMVCTRGGGRAEESD